MSEARVNDTKNRPLDGQTIPIIPLSQDSRYTVFGGDIEAFAGQSSELQFSVLPPTLSPWSGWNIDSITFSDQPIPEPQTGLLLVSGIGLLLLLRRRFRWPSSGNRE